VLPNTPSTFPTYVPSSARTMMASRAGEDPSKFTSKPPSWLLDSTVPVNISRPEQSCGQVFLVLSVSVVSSSLKQQGGTEHRYGGHERDGRQRS